MLKRLKLFINGDRYVKYLHDTIVNTTIDSKKKDQKIKELEKENKELRVLLTNAEVIFESTLKISMN